MRVVLPVLLGLCLACLPACGGDEREASPATGPVMRTAHAPVPFTLEQLAGACRPGRIDVYRVKSQQARHPVLVTQTWTGFQDNVASYEITKRLDVPEAPTVGSPEPRDVELYTLMQKWSWPAAATTISEQDVTTPAGTFACVVYTVRTALGSEGLGSGSPGSAMEEMHAFAKDRPGPPVRFAVTKDGEIIHAQELISYQDPAGR